MVSAPHSSPDHKSSFTLHKVLALYWSLITSEQWKYLDTFFYPCSLPWSQSVSAESNIKTDDDIDPCCDFFQPILTSLQFKVLMRRLGGGDHSAGRHSQRCQFWKTFQLSIFFNNRGIVIFLFLFIWVLFNSKLSCVKKSLKKSILVKVAPSATSW